MRTCAEPGCTTTTGKFTRGLCLKHYHCHWARGDYSTTLCHIPDCTGKAIYGGLCSAHYARKKRGLTVEIPIRRLAPKGSGYVNADGYRRVGKQLVHRTVMGQLLGRALDPTEEVHHKNGDRLDNRPENLELWSRGQLPGQRVSDMIEWAIDVLKKYAPERLAG